MKVWVVYADMRYDGYSRPLKVFSSKEKAAAYCGEDGDEELDWEELEIDAK